MQGRLHERLELFPSVQEYWERRRWRSLPGARPCTRSHWRHRSWRTYWRGNRTGVVERNDASSHSRRCSRCMPPRSASRNALALESYSCLSASTKAHSAEQEGVMAFKTVFDADFKYRSADATDIRLTFARIRREQRNAQRQDEAERTTAKVVSIGSSPNAAQSSNDPAPH